MSMLYENTNWRHNINTVKLPYETKAQLIQTGEFRTLLNQEAKVAKSFLNEKGIEVIISADDAGTLRPHLTFGMGVRLLVKKEDAEKARELLK